MILVFIQFNGTTSVFIINKVEACKTNRFRNRKYTVQLSEFSEWQF